MAGKGVNRVTIIGNLGQDPEQRFLPNGDAVTNISIATSESWNDKQTGQAQERTEWHRIVAFKKLAEIMAKHLNKGSKVYIEGSLRTRKWQAQDGSDRYSTEIIASQMQFLDSKQSDQPVRPQAQQQPARQKDQSQQVPDDFDQDLIPF